MEDSEYHLTYTPQQVAKILVHWELYKMIKEVPGAIIDCGVFKGGSLLRFALFRIYTERITAASFSKHIRENTQLIQRREMIAFDTFGEFPPATYEPDIKPREKFVSLCGDGFSADQVMGILKKVKCAENVELVQGDVCKTVPEYVKSHPDLEIALINMDTDLYEPAKVIIKHLYPLLVEGGILISDNYGIFPGETKAVQEKFGREVIYGTPFFSHPYYIKKEA